MARRPEFRVETHSFAHLDRVLKPPHGAMEYGVYDNVCFVFPSATPEQVAKLSESMRKANAKERYRAWRALEAKYYVDLAQASIAHRGFAEYGILPYTGGTFFWGVASGRLDDPGDLAHLRKMARLVKRNGLETKVLGAPGHDNIIHVWHFNRPRRKG